MMHKSTPTTPARVEDEPIYGFRYKNIVREDGSAGCVEIPLTLEDVLYPQEGDCIPENTIHSDERRYLFDVLKVRKPTDPHVRLFSDCIVDFCIEGMRGMSPDFSVFDQVKDPDWQGGLFRVRDHGARCLMCLEIVSPHTRTNDVDAKPINYERAKVPLYVVIDQKKFGGPRKLIEYRFVGDRFVKRTLKTDERLAIPYFGVKIGFINNRTVCYDLKTGEQILDVDEEHAARLAAEERAQVEEFARLAAEARVRELEEKLRRLRGSQN